MEENKTLKKQASQRKNDGGTKASPDDLLASAELHGEVRVVARSIDNASTRRFCGN